MKSRSRRQFHGFTLIELLIVVAIIAILAAIAVPNFLEAQVRAKISRTKNDQRAYATGFESYAVDNNRPPLGLWEDSAIYGAPTTDDEYDIQYARVFHALTTPIAYMTSVPLQVFTEKGAQGGVGAQSFYRKAYTYQCSVLDSCRGKNANATMKAMKGLGKSWMIAGYGPMRNVGGGPAKLVAMEPTTGPNANQLGYPDLAYDPSNGTVSFGYIIRSSAGIEPIK